MQIKFHELTARMKLCEILEDELPENCCSGILSSLITRLMAKGVTVEQWYPAIAPPKESGEYIVMMHKAASPTTLLYDSEDKSWFEVSTEGEEEVLTYYPVDCWTFLPQPPKEE